MKTDGSPLKKWLPAVINPRGRAGRLRFFRHGTGQRASAGKHAGRTRDIPLRLPCGAARKVEGVAFGLLTHRDKIAGRVWQDDDYDGVLSESLKRLARRGAITLLDGDGAEIAQTQTAKRRILPRSTDAGARTACGPCRKVMCIPRAARVRWRNARTKRRLRLDLGELHMGETLGG